jgi:hypothetical protein
MDDYTLVRQIAEAVERCRAEFALARPATRQLALRRVLGEKVEAVPADRRQRVLTLLRDQYPTDLRVEPAAAPVPAPVPPGGKVPAAAAGMDTASFINGVGPSDRPAETVAGMQAISDDVLNRGPDPVAPLPPTTATKAAASPAGNAAGDRLPPEVVDRLRKLALDTDQLVSRLWQAFTNNHHTQEIHLPGFARGLEDLLNQVQKGKPEAVAKTCTYIEELGGRLAGAFLGLKKSGMQWGKEWLDKAGPKAIEGKVKGGLFGGRERDCWLQYKQLAENVTPELIEYEMDLLAAKLAQDIYKPTGKSGARQPDMLPPG